MQTSIRQTHMNSRLPRVLTRSSGKPISPCPIRRTPKRQAMARLNMGSRVRKASRIASKGGIKDSHPYSIEFSREVRGLSYKAKFWNAIKKRLRRLSLPDPAVVADIVSLHQCFRSDHSDLRVESLAIGVISMANGSVPDISGISIAECFGP